MNYTVFVRYYTLSDMLDNNQLFSPVKEITISVPYNEVSGDMWEQNTFPMTLNEKFWNMVKAKAEKEIGTQIELAYGCHYFLN